MEEIKETKICSKCSIEKSVDEFGVRKDTKDGLNSCCKECIRIRSKMQYAKDLLKSRELSRLRSRKRAINYPDYTKQRKRNSYDNNRLMFVLKNRLNIAKKENILHDNKEILYEYLKDRWNRHECEICHKRLILGDKFSKDNSPSIDRIVPELGYVIDNISIICHRCNRIKNDATWQEHLMISNWQKEKEEIFRNRNVVNLT